MDQLRTAPGASLLSWVLGGLLLLVQLDLWFGKSNLPYVMGLQRQLLEQREVNEAARERNQRLQAEVDDLRDGLEMVEERARAELGMVRPDEIFVQLSPPRSVPAQAPR